MSKSLPRNLYKRGGQGTFVYAPDIAVFVATDDYGVQDLSNYVTSFTLTRQVNGPSVFSMTVDNKYGRFDRTVRRMDRIVVFLKRLSYLQVFSGYITEAPWETVVPGDVTITAQCTIKRLMHTYWDPYAEQSKDFFPMFLGRQWTPGDGGAAASMFLLLTIVAGWDSDKIQIQKIPSNWSKNAIEALKAARNELLGSSDYQTVLASLRKLVDADGWAGYMQSVGASELFGETGAATDGASDGQTDADVEWQKQYGKSAVRGYPDTQTSLTFASGFIPGTALKPTSVKDRHGKEIMLRADAAASLKSLVQQYGSKLGGQNSLNTKIEVSFAYLDYDAQKKYIDNHGGDCKNLGKMCPAGMSDHGWGTSIDFNSNSAANRWATQHTATMNKFGWYLDAQAHPVDSDSHWVFKGNWAAGYPSYTKKRPANAPWPGTPGSPATNPMTDPGRRDGTSSPIPSDQWQPSDSINPDTSGGSIFNVAFFAPQIDPASNVYVGKMAWINDVPLLDSVGQISAASMRDFQSAPNGDFVAFFPDRLGINGKFPVMQIRDIEIMDFKLSINDSNMATHVITVGDVTAPEPHTNIDFDALIGSGMVTIEQAEVMKIVFGLKADQGIDGFATEFMQKFGMRPYREDAFQIRDIGWLWLMALHRWEQAWANQWMARVQFTFMPELYPGMRIELMDRDPHLAVYVEQVSHSGSRSGGFSTQAVVSTPMIKKGKRWVMMKAELNPGDFGLAEAAIGRLDFSENPELKYAIDFMRNQQNA